MKKGKRLECLDEKGRMTFVAAVLVSTLWLFLSVQGCTPVMDSNADHYPNVLIIYTDDLGYGDVGCYNPESKIATPHIDRLASNGMLFTDAHSPASICTPSRYSLMTGRYPWRRIDRIVFPFGPSLIGEDELTVPKVLKEKGYHTALIGKWHLGWDWNWRGGVRPPEDQITSGGHSLVTADLLDFGQPVTGGAMGAGFDYYFGQDVPNFPPYAWMENGKFLSKKLVQLKAEEIESIAFRGSIHGDGPGEPGWRFDEVMPTLLGRAVSYLREMKYVKEPFFLLFATTSPHTPVVPVSEFHGKSEAGFYGDYIQQLDKEVGEIMRVLEETDQLRKTLIILTSDNGPEAIVKDVVANYGHRSMGPFRGVKWDVYEGGHRVPFIVHWPGVVKPNTKSDALISQLDIMATLASFVGVQLPADVAGDSYDFLPLLRQESTAAPRENLLQSTGSGMDRVFALRHKNWVYINANSGRLPWGAKLWFNEYERNRGVVPHDEPDELFDLSKDPEQRYNLVREERKLADEMRILLNTLLGS
ncbi:sulfatase family protein [Lunatimonas salinarum]|uniref:sulfatase family protein n=1 Tax=Lunatimonas salinarum TaxID=1774590 RepID=UPI001AE02B73|nr:arylsulfatase [Lunatimonas salinarum]